MSIDDLAVPDGAPIPFTHRYVVGSGSATAAWRGFMAMRMRKPLFRGVVVASFLLDALIYYAAFDASYSVGTRIVWSAVFALVTMVVIWVPLFALGYRVTTRQARHNWHDGAVLESGFGADTFVTRNPTIARRIRHDMVRSIDVRGEHVYIRLADGSRTLMYPRALFPDEEIARIKRSAARS